MRTTNITRSLGVSSWLGLGMLVAMAAPTALAAAHLEPTDLRCEYLTEPLGIEETRPRLSWSFLSDARGQTQTAYQVLVASNASLLQEQRGDLWDSGKVLSDQSVHVEYAGEPLRSGGQCFWKVRVWGTEAAASSWSTPARWTMGLLGAKEWHVAKWIGEAARAPGYASESYRWIWYPEGSPQAVAPPGVRYFRRVLHLPTGTRIREARFSLTCDNGFALFVNGRRAGESRDWSQPVVLDIREHLVAGANVLAIAATNESSAAGLTGKLTLRLEDRDEPLVVEFDQTWKASDRELPDWKTAGFDDRSWPAAMVLGPMSMAPWGVVRWPDGLPAYNLPPAVYLRRAFYVAKPVRRATLYATALGCYAARLNGGRVGQDYFTPGWPEFRKRVYYQTAPIGSP